ncbi:MAG: tRNA (adenosine(37)-N6)-dimethylallyltransferase MiaA [Terriglobales bacterium]
MTASCGAEAPAGGAGGSPVVVIAGPTASGKTALALALAEALGGEIVSFDSMQLYRDFAIGAAQPAPEELARVRHHFIGECDPRQPVTAGEYSRMARPRILDVLARGRLPVLVGGTGFYLRALLEGLFAAPPLPLAQQTRMRARLRRRALLRGPASLHLLLRRLDPAAAARIAPRDAVRAIRALEVRLLTGRPISRCWAEHPPQPFRAVRPLQLGLAPPRAQLHARIEARAVAMFCPPPGARGILAETADLLRVYPEELAVFSAHGYKQAVDVLCRGADPSVALAEAQAEQRQYAKRQFTWFRRDPSRHWLAGFGADAVVRDAALDWLHRSLGGGARILGEKG